MIKNQVFGPTGLMLWAFIDRPTFPGFLNSVTRLTPQEVEELIPKWALAAEVRSTLSPLPRPVLPSSPIDPPVREYVESFEQTPIFQALRQQFKKATFAYVPCDMLVNPLVFIDNEFLDNIKPELQSTEPIDVVKFALPTQISAEVKAVTDPSMHNVYFVTNLKTLTVGPAQILQTPVGTEVKFLINSNLSITLVSALQDRFIIRNGIHRAFLLARLGIKNIPCILVEEESLPNLVTSAYPSFTPVTLMQPRPPLLVDLFNDKLSIEVPLLRTNKVIRILAEESILPVD